MWTFWKKFWNPIEVSSTPTCEGYVPIHQCMLNTYMHALDQFDYSRW